MGPSFKWLSLNECRFPFAPSSSRTCIHFEGSLVSGQKELEDMIHFVLKHKIRVKTNIYKNLDSVNLVVDAAHSGKVSGKLVVVLDRAAVEADKAKDCW
ncbi:hypothetical protein Trisim1_010260 [Trichoderma cf. simile WF8]